MKEDQEYSGDEMRPEYRREDLGTGVRGKYLEEYRKNVTFVVDGSPGVKVDAVRLMREIRDEVSREIEGMSYEDEKRSIKDCLTGDRAPKPDK